MFFKSNNKLLKSIFSYTTAVVVAQAFIAVYTLLLIWWLNTETYGSISANYAAVTLTSFIISLGLHDWLIRSIPFHKNANELTGSILVYKLVAGFIWALFLILILPMIRPSIYTWQLLILIIVDVWAESSFFLLLADLLGHEKVIPTSLMLVLSRVLRLSSLIIVILMGSKSPYQIVLFRLISTMLVFLITILLTKPAFTAIRLSEIARVLKSSIVFNAAEIQNLVFLQIDLNLLTIISGNRTSIGDFAIVVSVINMIMTLPLGIASMLLPNAIKSYKESKERFFTRMKSRLFIFSILGLILWSSINVFRLDFLQNLLPDNYQHAVQLLILSSPLLFIRTLTQFNRVYLISVGWEKKQLLPQIIGILSKIVLGILLLIRFGLEGLIIASIASDLIVLLGFSTQTIRHRNHEKKLAIR